MQGLMLAPMRVVRMSLGARASATATGVWGFALGAVIVGVIAMMAGFGWGAWIVVIGFVVALLAVFTGRGHGGA